MLEQIQIITPAGIETQIDLISTNKVLSITDLIIVFGGKLSILLLQL